MAMSWGQLVARGKGLESVDAYLRGAGQVMFQNNPLTGLLFLAGIFWGASRWVALAATGGLVIATATARKLVRVDAPSLRSGLYGFNGILVGAGLATFVQGEGFLAVAYIALGAVVSVYAMSALSSVLAAWKTPALTSPFVLVCCWMLLAAYGLSQLSTSGLGPAVLPHAASGASGSLLDPLFLLEAWLKGVGQVFLVGNAVTGAIFVVALAVSSWRAALFALLGSAAGMGTALAFGASRAAVGEGLYGFSAVLTAIALGATFYPSSARTTGVALVGAVFTAIVQAGLDVALQPLGIPTLTSPFVFVTWLFLLPHLQLAPVPHAPLTPVPHAPLAGPAVKGGT
jgi:urea transporter